MVQYFTPSSEALARQMQLQKKSESMRFSGKKEEKFAKGSTIWRILPPWSQEGALTRIKCLWFKKTLGWNCIEDGALPIIWECWPGENDPIYNAITRITSTHNMDDKLKYTTRYICNALILQHTEPGSNVPSNNADWATPRVLELPKTVNNWVLAQANKAPISDPYKGFWLETTRTGEGKNDTEYQTTYAPAYIDNRAIATDESAIVQIITGLTNLDSHVGTLDDELMAKQQQVAEELLMKYGFSSNSSAPVMGGITPFAGISAPPVSKNAPSFPGAPVASAPAMPQQPPMAMPPVQQPIPSVPMPAPVVTPPVQQQATLPFNNATLPNGTKACFAGLTPENMYLNSRECATCPQEIECQMEDKKKRAGAPVVQPTASQPQQQAVPQTPAALPKVNVALPTCLGNKKKGKGPDLGFTCESCIYASACPLYGN